MSSSATFVTPECVFSYVNVFKPRSFEQGGDAKYSTMLLIPKDSDLTQIMAEFNKVLLNDFEGTLPYGATPIGGSPLIDGAVRYPGDEFYQNFWVLNASQSADRSVQVLDKNYNPIIDQNQFYSGCKGHALISFYGFFGGKKGISCSLHAVMKTADGTPLGSTVDARSSFAAALGATLPPSTPAAPVPPSAPAPAAPLPPSPPAAPTAPIHHMTAKANGATYEQFVANGWTLEQLIEQGYVDDIPF